MLRIMFTMVNIFDQEKIQQVQKLNLIECKKSEIDKQLIKPQTQRKNKCN